MQAGGDCPLVAFGDVQPAEGRLLREMRNAYRGRVYADRSREAARVGERGGSGLERFPLLVGTEEFPGTRCGLTQRRSHRASAGIECVAGVPLGRVQGVTGTFPSRG